MLSVQQAEGDAAAIETWLPLVAALLLRYCSAYVLNHHKNISVQQAEGGAAAIETWWPAVAAALLLGLGPNVHHHVCVPTGGG